MPTGQDLVNSAVRFRGEPYSTDNGRTSQTSGFKDCSGLVYAALVGVGANPGGNTVSTTLETWAVNNGGHYVDKQYAIDHPGVGLAIWGSGADGHIGMSAGGGQAFETPSGEGHKAGFSSLNRNRWGEYFTFPGITYEGTPTQEDDLPFTEAQLNQIVKNQVALLLEGDETYRNTLMALVRSAPIKDGAAQTVGGAVEEAALFAKQADDRTKKIMDKLGISE